MSPRSLFPAVLSLLLMAAGAAAADHPQRLSFFTANPSTDGTGTLGLAYSYGFSPRWTVEVSGGVQHHYSYLEAVYQTPGPHPRLYWKQRAMSYPVSGRLIYRHETGGRLTPIFGLGVHHVATPKANGELIPVPSLPVPPVDESEAESRTFPDVIAGVELRLTSRLGLRLQVERLFNVGDRLADVNYDRVNKGVLALSWRLR